MIDGNFTQFTLDIGTLDRVKFNKLRRLGECEKLDFGLFRWTFPLCHREEVEKILDDRIIFQVRHLRKHIVGLDLDEHGSISIKKGADLGKFDEVERMKSIVASVLQDDVKARSSDKWLILKVLQRLGFEVYADYEMIAELPSFETITRCRRKFQEEGLYPADEVVFEIRKDNEKQMHKINDWFGMEEETKKINKME